MNIAVVTGSCGLVGSAAVKMLAGKMDLIIGIDNDRRKFFFGEDASTAHMIHELYTIPSYIHHSVDIREAETIDRLFSLLGHNIKLVVHTAAQPSHDWAATNVMEDFSINAIGTLNLLQSTRQWCKKAVFIFTSTNKVYGDTPNQLPLIENQTRYLIKPGHPFEYGITEEMSIDQCKHSLFGVSKSAADLLVQEYGRYFGLNTGVFRCGCISGAAHAGSKQHGFLSYLMKCAYLQIPYTIIGYGGKQVRDNIDAADLAEMFWQFYLNPRPGEVYNAGGGIESNCSVLEAISIAEKITGKPMQLTYDPVARSGDHQWYISSLEKFKAHYPEWKLRYGVEEIMNNIYSYLQS